MLTFKSLNYINAALWNWDRRRSRLITVWCNATGERKAKAWRLSTAMDDRIRVVNRYYGTQREKIKEQLREADLMRVHLTCPDRWCTFEDGSKKFVVVFFKDYEPGKLKCEICGEELKPKQI
jgi:hypothetical protein